jgi:hypothetical protein
MWEVKTQRKAEGRAMKARGNVQVEAEGGTCRTPHQARVAGMQGRPFRAGRREHGHLPQGRVHPVGRAYRLGPLLNKDLHFCVSSWLWHRCSARLSRTPQQNRRAVAVFGHAYAGRPSAPPFPARSSDWAGCSPCWAKRSSLAWKRELP